MEGAGILEETISVEEEGVEEAVEVEGEVVDMVVGATIMEGVREVLTWAPQRICLPSRLSRS